VSPYQQLINGLTKKEHTFVHRELKLYFRPVGLYFGEGSLHKKWKYHPREWVDIFKSFLSSFSDMRSKSTKWRGCVKTQLPKWGGWEKKD